MKQFAIAVPRKYWLQVASTRTVYITGPRSAHDYIPILDYEPVEGAKPVKLGDNFQVAMIEGSPLNNQLFIRDVEIISNKQFYRLIQGRG